MVDLAYGQLDDGSDLYFGDLNQAIVEGFTHNEASRITLVDNGTHSLVPVFVDELGGDLTVYDAGQHEFLPAPSAPVYDDVQSSVISLFDGGAHEFIAAPTQVYDHIEPSPVTLSDSGTHAFFPGIQPGDFLHSEPSPVLLSDNGTHAFSPAEVIAQAVINYGTLQAWLAPVPSEGAIDFSSLTADVQRITLTVTSDDPSWLGIIGQSGGTVSVFVEAIVSGSPVGLVSLNRNDNTAQLFEYGEGADRFRTVADALRDGTVRFRAGGFEALADRSIPIEFDSGSTSLTIEAQT